MSRNTRLYLGALELTVLEALWCHGQLDAKAVHRIIGTRRGVGLNTIQSTLERLFRKQLLQREKVRHAYVYTPAVQCEVLMARLIEDVVETFSSDRSEPMLTAFVNLAARVDEDNLTRLEQLIATRRARAKDREL